MSDPSIHKLRKGVVLFAAFLVLFVIYGLFFSRMKEVQQKMYSPEIATTLCGAIISEKCIDEDTVFSVNKINGIQALSVWDSLFQPEDTIYHSWYYGSELIQTTPCIIGKTSCKSSLAIENYGLGEFSVDMTQQDVLLSTAQFHINP